MARRETTLGSTGDWRCVSVVSAEDTRVGDSEEGEDGSVACVDDEDAETAYFAGAGSPVVASAAKFVMVVDGELRSADYLSRAHICGRLKLGS